MAAKTEYINFKEEAGGYRVTHTLGGNTGVQNSNGTELRPLASSLARRLGDATLATAIDGITIAPIVGWKPLSKRSGSIEVRRGGKLDVVVADNTEKGADDRADDYPRDEDSFVNPRAAIVYAMQEIGADIFAGQIRDLA